MNRPGGVPQSLRGLPNGFNGQQQQQPQQARSVSSRLPNGKMNNNASGWAFGSGVPLGGGAALGGAGGSGLQGQGQGQGQGQSQNRQQMGSNISFAQSLGGSQPATPLDLSEFPSLSNSSQLTNSGQASLWSTAGSRNIGGQAIQRGANTPQQEDMFGASARLQSSNQGSFRFGNQAAAGLGQASIGQPSQQQPSQQQQPGSIDDFPPLNNRAANAGEIGQDRTASLMSSLGYGSQTSATSPAPPGVGAPGAGAPVGAVGGGTRGGMGNGLLNALSANSNSNAAPGSRVTSGGGAEVRSPVGTRPQETRADEEAAARQRQDSESAAAASAAQSPIGGEAGGASRGADGRSSIGTIGGDVAGKESEAAGGIGPTGQDPLAGMAPIDRWGMKGLRSLLNNPEYSAMISGFGLDLNSLGVDLNANEHLSTQTYSLFDGVAPRPAIPKFRLPECYKVSNVGPIENKISSFNEETLMWIFYSCPNDIKQQLAAIELNNRNWRWHKRQQVWLTKDDMMMPQVLSHNHERGYYIVWDTATWRKERTSREITLSYGDLDNAPNVSPAVV